MAVSRISEPFFLLSQVRVILSQVDYFEGCVKLRGFRCGSEGVGNEGFWV